MKSLIFTIIITMVSGIISLIVTYLITPWFTKYFKKIGLTVKDQNKKNKPLVPLSAGIPLIVGLVAGLFFYIFYITFFPGSVGNLDIGTEGLPILFAATTTIIIITFVGFMDDLLIRKDKETSYGLKQWQKPLLTLVAAIPLMVIKAGTYQMAFPFIGVINFGVLYPLLLIPIGVVGASNMVNMLGGFNGLEVGMGIIYMTSLGLYAFQYHRWTASIISLVVVSGLIALWFYNKTPAKILAGDSLTYLLGASLVTVAIIGNIERAAIIISIPFFIEFILKARGKFKKQTYGYEVKGKIKSKYDKIYSIPHFFTISGKFTEKQIVYFMLLIQLIFAITIWVI